MKRNYMLCALIALGFSMSAQNFVYSTDQHIEDVVDASFSDYNISFSTQNAEAITYEYELISNTLPAEWATPLCDYTGCYAGVPATGTMTPISLSDAQNNIEGFFKLTINHMDVAGEGIVEIYVFESGNYERGDTVSWHLTKNFTVATEEVEIRQSFKVYPNPTTEQLTIDLATNFTGKIFNRLGQNVLQFAGNEQKTVDVSMLTSGVYWVYCQDASGMFLSKQFVVK